MKNSKIPCTSNLFIPGLETIIIERQAIAQASLSDELKNQLLNIEIFKRFESCLNNERKTFLNVREVDLNSKKQTSLFYVLS